MKKILPIIFIVLLIGAGYFLLNNNKTEKKPSKEKIQEAVNQKKQDVVQEIKEMAYKNVSLKCIYETPEGTKVTTYLKGKDQIRSKIENKNQKSETIFLKNKIYVWDNNTKEGMILNVNQNIKNENEKIKIENPDKYLEELEKVKAKCSQTILSDNIFQPPADIKFQDLDKIQEMMNQGNFQMTEQETEE